MLGENYLKTRCNALKRIIKVCTKNNEFFSSHIIAICLKEINTLIMNDDGICFFEVLQDQMLMDDNCTQARLEMILGVPNLKFQEDSFNNYHYGLEQESNLEKACIEFISPIKISHGPQHLSI